MEDWERRLRWLAGNPKTPKRMAEDLAQALLKLEELRKLNKEKKENEQRNQQAQPAVTVDKDN